MLKAVFATLALLLVFSGAQAFEITKTVRGGDYVEVVAVPAGTASGNLDVLFLVDNSGSMHYHQANLEANVDQLVKAVAGVAGASIHAGVITTDMENRGDQGRLVGSPLIASSSTPTFSSDLRKNILVGTKGSGYEMYFEPLIAALSEPLASTHNAGFRRADAHLAVVMLSDAEDQSAVSVDEFVMKMSLFSTAGISMYGFVVPSSLSIPQTSQCIQDQGKPLKVEEAVTRLKGELYNICESDFGKNLSSIGSKLATKIDRVINLPNSPQLNTMVVTYGATSLQFGDARLGWTYDSIENTVVIGDKVDFSTQPSGTEIRVRYTPVGWLL